MGWRRPWVFCLLRLPGPLAAPGPAAVPPRPLLASLPERCRRRRRRPRSNRFVDVLEESIAEWARQQSAATRPVSIDISMHGGPHAAQHSDFEDDHSSKRGAGAGACTEADAHLQLGCRHLRGWRPLLLPLLPPQHPAAPRPAAPCRRHALPRLPAAAL